MKYNNCAAYLLLRGEMLYFIQQCWIRSDITEKMLYSVQDCIAEFVRQQHPGLKYSAGAGPGLMPLPGFRISDSSTVLAWLYQSVVYYSHKKQSKEIGNGKNIGLWT